MVKVFSYLQMVICMKANMIMESFMVMVNIFGLLVHPIMEVLLKAEDMGLENGELP